MENQTTPPIPLAGQPEEGAELARLAERHRRQAEAIADARDTSPKSSGYPCTVEVACVCKRSGCGKPFRVPVAYLAENRPVGGVPDHCPACVEAAEAREADRIRQEREAQARSKREREEKSVLARVQEAGGNAYEYADLTLDGFRARPGREKSLDAVREWTAAVIATGDKYLKIRGIYLVGETGTAKTALAHCSLRALLEAGLQPVRDVIFDDSLSLIERIQGTYGSDENTWRLLEARIFARVWILDDLMSEKPTPDVVRKLTLIFNRREGRPSMVTSNENPAKLTELNPDYYRLASRFGPAQFRTVRASGEDARFDRPDVRRVASI
jgi:DNA replication protein DnaC